MELEKPKRSGGDIAFPSDNQYGVPRLLEGMQAVGVSLPFYPYGKVSLPRQKGTIHFYVDDVKFDHFWTNPELLERAVNCKSVVEPNFTVSLESPPAWVIYTTFKKRWLARFWQGLGFTTIVDVNVPPEFSAVNFLGVPKSWRMFSTRAYSNALEALDNEFKACVTHCETSDITFIVYGGGINSKSLCMERGWLWLPDEIDRSRGRIQNG